MNGYDNVNFQAQRQFEKLNGMSGIFDDASKIIETVTTALDRGPDQDRFFDRYFEVKAAFNAAGYPVVGDLHDSLLDKYQIRKTQVRDYKKEGYQAEFDRLHSWMVEMMNIYNPGLGDYWNMIQPSLPLVTGGNISGLSLDTFKQLVKMYPPYSYDFAQPFGSSPASLPSAYLPKPATSNTYHVIKDAAGQITQIKNAAGQLLQPGTPEYNQAALQATGDQPGWLSKPTNQMIAMVGGVLLLAGGAYLYNQHQKSKN